MSHYKHTSCDPLIMEKVCATGQKCFHNVHFLFENTEGNPIPSDACPIDCLVSDFFIYQSNTDFPTLDFSPPRRIEDCICFTVHYKVRVWYEFTNTSGIKEVNMALGEFDRELCVPIEEVGNGCVRCVPETTNICIRCITLNCIKATLISKPANIPEYIPQFAIHVTVEKEFFCLKSSQAIVCFPICKEPCVELPPFISGQGCAPFEKEGICDNWCEDTDFDPDNCAQCPPPQVFTTTTTTSTSTTTTATFTTTFTTSTNSTTSTTSTTTNCGICPCSAYGGGTSILPSGEIAYFRLNLCPSCNFGMHFNYSTILDGPRNILKSQELLEIVCGEKYTWAEIKGKGIFAHGSDLQEVTFWVKLDSFKDRYSLTIWNNIHQTIFSTGDSPIYLAGDGISIWECD